MSMADYIIAAFEGSGVKFGDEFREDLDQRISQGLEELKEQKRRRMIRLQHAYEVNRHLRVTI